MQLSWYSPIAMYSIQLIEAYNLLGNESDQSHYNCSRGKKDAIFICKIARAAHPSRRQNNEHLACEGAMDRSNTTIFGRRRNRADLMRRQREGERRETTGRRAILWCEDWRERSTAWSSRAGRQGSSAASSAATHASMSSRPPAPGAGCC
jgi:hypothetical protein